MFRRPKALYSFGAAALATTVLLLSTPRAAHALAAALVQVTNTAANPVTTQGIGQQAAQMIRLYSNSTYPSPFELAPNGSPSDPAYTVPAGQSLVVTSVDLSQSCNTPQEVNLDFHFGASAIRKSWTVQGSNLTNHFEYPSGLVMPSGTTGHVSSSCQWSVEIFGYLTAN